MTVTKPKLNARVSTQGRYYIGRCDSCDIDLSTILTSKFPKERDERSADVVERYFSELPPDHQLKQSNTWFDADPVHGMTLDRVRAFFEEHLTQHHAGHGWKIPLTGKDWLDEQPI